MRAALKRGVETGALVQVKNSYKLSPGEKAKKVPASKEAKPKKATATKAKVSVLGLALVAVLLYRF